MKKLYTFIVAVLVTTILQAQAPASFKYQAVLRDARGNIRANTQARIGIDLLQGSAIGITVYRETHNVTTDSYGLINIEIGKGTSSVESLSVVDWSAGSYFIKVIVDGLEMGTSQLLSVPYALYAKTAGNGFSGSYNDLTARPALFDGAWGSLTGRPAFATVATSGRYNDLTNKPVIFSGDYASLTGKPTLSLVASTGSYTNLLNKPVLFDGNWSGLIGKPTTISGFGITDAVTTEGDQTVGGNKIMSDKLVVLGKTSVGTSNPEASAALDVYSTSQGFLPPRMTYAQKIAIVAPAAGLIVWCSNCGPSGEIQVNNGITWTNMLGGTATASLPIMAATTAVTSITGTTAMSGGNIADNGGAEITEMGVCWSTSANPTIADSTTTDGTGIGPYISAITGLIAGTTYYVRSYSSNSLGTSYGVQESFSTPISISTDGLVGYYPFNGNANDESVNNYNGTVTGAVLSPDRFGTNNSAYYFNGINNKIYLGNSLIVQGQISVSCWVKSTATSGQIISTGSRNSYRIGKTADGVDCGLYLSDASDGYGIGTSAIVNCSDWTHVVIVYNGSEIKLYINGQLKNNSTGVGSVFCNQTVYLNFGTYQWGSSYIDWYKGYLDDVRLYDRAINTEELNALYHEGGWQTTK